jgi:NitT/TauT family transport system permease protein
MMERNISLLVDDGRPGAAAAGTLPASVPGRAREKLQAAFVPQGSIGPAAAALLASLSFGMVFFIWFLATTVGGIDRFFLPSIGDTMGVAWQLLASRAFLLDIGMTVFRVLAGFLLAAVVAVPLGLLIGTYAPLSGLLEYLFSFVRYLPASAFIPLFILWIGIDEPEKIAVIILGSLPQLVLMVATNVRNTPSSMVEAAYTLGVSRAGVLWKIILPKALPDIVDTLRIVLGWAWTYVIVAEMVGASSGIGYMIIQSQRMMDTSRIFVGILAIGLIGMFIDVAFKAAHNYCFAWNNDR